MRPIRCLLAAATLAVCPTAFSQTFHPNIPRTWATKDVADTEVPLAQPDRSPRYPSEQEYYALKVRTIYRSYPVYAEGREPAGYIESLKQKDPEVIFDPSKLKTKEDWIRAGKIVFEADNSFRVATPVPGGTKIPVGRERWVAPDGVIPNFTPGMAYIIRKKGVLEVGSNSCAGCHTRLLPDGTVFEGGQGDTTGNIVQPRPDATADQAKARLENMWVRFGIPWVQPREEFEKSFTDLKPALGNYQSVFSREGSSLTHPVHIPSLIGIQDRKYLDATGLVRHRSIGDVMRYAMINEGMDTNAHFGDFQPTTGGTAFSQEDGTRFSDEQLYALALYIYSLRPPPNPNPVDDRARAGQRVFQRQGCPICHTPPYYTNNKLTLARGFQPTDAVRKTVDILDVSVGTDPVLATRTRRGTGFYKVPSLLGVWYRSAFGHTGQADTLEEWFNPARLQPDFEPKGYRRGPGPIEGHEFGLKLSPEDRTALIAFLKTL
jgi:mono/diheme cytochrome c family protein